MGDLRQSKQKAHPVSVATAAKMQQAMSLRAAGASYSQIGEALRCTKKYAHELVMKGMAELAAQTIEDAQTVKLVELMRLDSMLMALWPSTKNPRTADTILRIAERRAKLLGLDAPSKIAQTDPDGGAIPVDQNITVTFVESE